MVKKNMIKCIKTAMLVAAMGTTMTTTAFAADATKITNIDLNITSNIDEKEDITDVTVKTDSKLFEVTDWSITNEPDEEWEGNCLV